MNRKDFLSSLGIGAAAIACSYCLESCTPEDIPSAPTNVDFTLDLNAPENSTLQPVGGYLYKGGIIVAHSAVDMYVAVSMACTHAGNTIDYDSTNHRFHCPVHGSNFNPDGSVINGPATSPLATYHTSLSGTTLRVFS